MNRLYYACFYAVMALFIDGGIEAKSHDGMKRMFGKHFIATKIFDVKHGRFYSQILQAPIQGDYDDFYAFNREACENLIEQGRDFIQTIETHLSRNNEYNLK